jgi:hypothetical protein
VHVVHRPFLQRRHRPADLVEPLDVPIEGMALRLADTLFREVVAEVGAARNRLFAEVRETDAVRCGRS